MKKFVVILLIAVVSMGTAFSQNSIAHLNSQRVLDTMPSRKAAMKEVENFEKRAIQELQETQQKLQQDYAKLQQEKATMSPTAYKFEEDRLNKKAQEFQQRQQELDQQIQILSQDLNQPILERLQKAVDIVSKAEKLDYVIDESSLLYSKGKDITNKVIVEVLKLENAASSTTPPTGE
jgi:outer membrane protein